MAPMERERRTLEVMIGMYCRSHHPHGAAPCPECTNLLAYGLQKLEECPHRRHKPVCSRCRTHCYESGKRQAVRQVMRFAGPRMLLRHPWLAVMHLIDRLRPSR